MRDSFSVDFRFGSAPRSVPTSVRLRVLFGGFINQFGWLFFGFGMIFFWIFVLNSDLTGWLVFSGELETVEGVVTESRGTGASVGGSDHSEGTPVYANAYRFSYDREEHSGVSYATGRKLEAGQSVKIEMPKGDPSRSRIEGMRTALFGPFAAAAAIFPFVGLCFVIFGLRKGRKAIRLLRDGKQAEGTLVSKKATSTRVNKQPVYKLTFEFTADDGRTYQAVAKTHQTEDLEDEAREPLLYDPVDPSYATMLDALPGRPRIDDMGTIHGGSVVKTLLVSIVPAASVVGHGIYACLRYF